MNYFCWHDWTAWSKLHDTDFVCIKRQFRICKTCKQVATRKIYMQDTTTAESINKSTTELLDTL